MIEFTIKVLQKKEKCTIFMLQNIELVDLMICTPRIDSA